MASQRQRAANRANARKSTGPKSKRGKYRASLNATKHALTQPLDASPWGEHLQALADLLQVDGVDQASALELAAKILDYERNLAYQRKRFVEFKEAAPPGYETPVGALADLYVAQELDKASRSENPIFGEELDREMAKYLRQIAKRDVTAARGRAEKVLRNADRHLRRSANQLTRRLGEL